MAEYTSRTTLLGLALLCALVGAVAFQGSRGLYESTEGRYAECAREMIVTGDYLRPTLDFAPHWTKPPLTYWAIAAGVQILGRNAWGARGFLIPTFFLTVLGVYWLGRWLWAPRTGSVAALIYATSWGPAGAASTVNADSLLTLWETLALACFWWGVRSRRNRAAGLMWFFFGMAFFTKGPPALLPLLALGVFRALTRDRSVRSAPFFVPAGIGLFLAVGLWWYALSMVRYPGLLPYWLKHEVVGRVATEEFHRNAQWYKMFTVYWPFLLGGALPWLAVTVLGHGRALWAFFGGFRRWRLPDALSDLKTTFKDLSAEGLFLLVAFFVPLTVFSLSRSRMPLYILPLFPVVACFLARHVDSLAARGFGSRRKMAAVALVSTAIIITGKGVAAHWPSKRDMGAIFRALEAAVPPKDRSGTPLYLVSQSPCYGLQFYWGDPFIRIHRSPDEAPDVGFLPFSALWADMGLNPTSGSAGRLAVTRKENAPFLEDALQRRGHRVATKPLTPHWSLLEVSPPDGGVKE
ncbi:MAG: glycosyltransferase family 39 protein [Desulfosoma sp.]